VGGEPLSSLCQLIAVQNEYTRSGRTMIRIGGAFLPAKRRSRRKRQQQTDD
jgi:hypothetical protein